jgi:RND family efflux transporter MFP subunit
MNKALFAKLLQPGVVISLAVVIAIGSVSVAYISTSHKPAGNYGTPTVGEISQEVDTTGTVQAATSLDLSFQSSGQISYVSATVGTHVGAGATLARLSGATLSAQLEQAQAALAIQQAKLAGLMAGATPQSVSQSQTAVSNAQSTLAQANQGVIAASQDAYVKADDAIHNRVDTFFNNPRSTSPSLMFPLSSSQLTSSIVAGRIAMETLLNQWQAYEQSLSVGGAIDTSVVAATSLQYSTQVSAYLDQVAAGLTSAIPTTSYPLTTIQGYESSVATARANMSAIVTEMNAAKTAETSARAGLASAQSGLSVTTAPPTATDLQAQQAAVAAAQANVDVVQAQIGQTVISAPISGTITVNNAHVGETASPGAPLISMISDSQFQMAVYVSDQDIAKVKVGDVASVTLDAYQSGSAFATHVIQVDPAATLQSGVSSYKVTLQFDKNDPLIQAGMTGSVKIITETHESALSVPTSALITRGTDTFVIVQSASGDQQVKVVTGIESAAGMTEITSGLSASDRVRSFGSIQ